MMCSCWGAFTFAVAWKKAASIILSVSESTPALRARHSIYRTCVEVGVQACGTAGLVETVVSHASTRCCLRAMTPHQLSKGNAGFPQRTPWYHVFFLRFVRATQIFAKLVWCLMTAYYSSLGKPRLSIVRRRCHTSQSVDICDYAAIQVMFGYVFIRRGNFNNFEEAFLLTTAGFETAAETFYVLAGISVYSSGQRKGFWRAMATNPVHHYARALLLGGSQERRTQYFAAANVAMFVALTSLVPWALFCPVWGPSFEAESGDVMMALSTWSCVGVVVLILSVAFSVPVYDFCRHSSDWSQVMFHSIISMILYISIKVFEVYVLLSDPERLCSSAFGKALVGLQLSEVVSIAAFVAALLIGSPRCPSPRSTFPLQEDWLRANTMARPSEFFDASLFPDPSLFLSRESSSSSPA